MMVRLTENQSKKSEILHHLELSDESFVPYLSQRVKLEDYAEKLADKAIRFEAWDDAQLIGLVAIYLNAPSDGPAFVSSVSVSPEARGQGIAETLMNQAMTRAEERNFCAVELDVFKEADAALALYNKLGFTIVSASSSWVRLRWVIPGGKHDVNT